MCNSGGASHFDVNTKNTLHFKNSNLVVGAGGGFFAAKICIKKKRRINQNA